MPSFVNELRRVLPVLLLAPLGASLVGCADEAITKQHQQCTEICAKFSLCDDRSNTERCERTCGFDTFWSEPYWDERGQCVENLSCNRLPSTFDELVGHQALDVCINEGLRALPLSAEQQRICASMSTKLESCDASLDASVLQVQCLNGPVRKLHEEYLLASEACIHERCVDIQRCLDDLAEHYDAPVRLYDGTLNGD